VKTGTQKASVGARAGAGAGAETSWKSEPELEPKQIVSAPQHWKLVNFKLQFSPWFIFLYIGPTYFFKHTESILLHFDIVSLLKTIIKNTVVLLILANFYFHHGCVVSKYFDSDAKRLPLSSARPPWKGF
jgi:hypothetical protein